MIAEPSSSTRTVGTAVVAAAFALLAFGTCRRPEHVTAASIAWDGHALTAVWERSDDRDGSTVYVHRFADLRPGVTTHRGTAIHHQDHARSNDIPEIASDAMGSLVFVVGPRWNQFAIPLTADGAVAGPAQPLTSCSSDSSERVCVQMCRRPVAFGGGFALGHLDAWPRSGPGAKVVGISFLTRDGKTVRDVTLQAGGVPSGCAVASTGSRLVVAVAEQTRDHAYGIRIHFLGAKNHGALWIPDAVRAIALVPTGEDAALLYETREGTLRVARVDESGVGAPVILPGDVDAATVDLGIGEHGPFFSWIAGKRVFMRDVATAGVARAAIRDAKPMGTRAIGTDRHCVAAWSAAAGMKVGVLSAACP